MQTTVNDNATELGLETSWLYYVLVALDPVDSRSLGHYVKIARHELAGKQAGKRCVQQTYLSMSSGTTCDHNMTLHVC